MNIRLVFFIIVLLSSYVYSFWQNKNDAVCSICQLNPTNQIPHYLYDNGVTSCTSPCPMDGNPFCGSKCCPVCNPDGMEPNEARRAVAANKKKYEAKTIFGTASAYSDEHPTSSFHWVAAILTFGMIGVSIIIVGWLVYIAIVYTVISPPSNNTRISSLPMS